MRKTGQTNEGNVILECNQNEYRALVGLAMSIEGKSLEDAHFYSSGYVLPDFTSVIGAMEAFAMAKFRVNALQDLINQFNATLNQRESE